MFKYIAILALVLVPTAAAYSPDVQAKEQDIMCRAEKVETKETLTHRQQVWKHALEWCESRGNPNAINPMDRDGTASLGGFQFKPSTLDAYALRYGIATTTVMDYEVQSGVVDQMILHHDDIKWENEFPDCVRKLGRPPKT